MKWNLYLQKKISFYIDHRDESMFQYLLDISDYQACAAMKKINDFSTNDSAKIWKFSLENLMTENKPVVTEKNRLKPEKNR